MKRHVWHIRGAIVTVSIGVANTTPRPAQSEAETKTPWAFEVASVKLSNPGQLGGMIRPLPGGQTYIATNVPLRLMIRVMYKITDSQIVGAPAWVDTEFYDVQAKAASPSSLDKLHEMFQTLLADWFKLQFHRETHEGRAYVLTVDRSGSKLTASENQEPFDNPIKAAPGRLIGTRVPLSYLCFFLSGQLNVPVIDRTDLAGYYDFTLDWMPQPMLAVGPDRPETPGFIAPTVEDPELVGALRRQLGLNLESRKAPVEVFVIDHVERPAAN
jgi:uncharacterized protein (TIGR03435 family)